MGRDGTLGDSASKRPALPARTASGRLGRVAGPLPWATGAWSAGHGRRISGSRVCSQCDACRNTRLVHRRKQFSVRNLTQRHPKGAACASHSCRRRLPGVHGSPDQQTRAAGCSELRWRRVQRGSCRRQSQRCSRRGEAPALAPLLQIHASAPLDVLLGKPLPAISSSLLTWATAYTWKALSTGAGGICPSG